jgi:hypothetical protein
MATPLFEENKDSILGSEGKTAHRSLLRARLQLLSSEVEHPVLSDIVLFSLKK